MAPVLEIRQADGSTTRTPLQPGINRVPVDTGASYRIFDEGNPLPLGRLVVRRADNDLVVEHLGAVGTGSEAALALPDYYILCGTSNTCALSIEGTGAPVLIDASTSRSVHLPTARSSSTTRLRAFHRSGFTDSLPLRPVLYTLGGLAVAGLAAGRRGGGDDGPTAVSGPVANVRRMRRSR